MKKTESDFFSTAKNAKPLVISIKILVLTNLVP